MSENRTDATAAEALSWSRAAGRFIFVLPAWLAAVCVVRVGELLAGGALDGRLMLSAAGFDAVDFLRWLPLLFLSAWPLLRRPSPWPLALLWSLLLLAQMALSSYFLVARTPLGSDLFGYSWEEILATVRGADVRVHVAPLLEGLLALAVLWAGLWLAWRPWPRRSWRTAPVLLGLAGLAWLLPLHGGWLQGLDLDSRLRVQDKAGFFLESLAQMLQPTPSLPAVAAAGAAPGAEAAPLNPDYPFLHPDRTPDVLGQYFSPAGRPPSLVFVVVEGLGRDFSGPNARLGSFTPFLDELAGRSLYFDHFIAPQGRTFGVLPSLFGSLPFGERGFADLGSRMPAHPDLFSVLRSNGYDARFYNGTNLDFDSERAYLNRQGVSKLHDLLWYQRDHALPAGSNSWGFPDADLLRLILADEAKQPDAPGIVALQTITMHTDYHFPDQERYRARVLERLRELKIPESRWQYYRDNIDIFSTVVYTDDALREFFTGLQALPGHANTVYIITGDHRLPELPMADVLERHHVPLLIYSPLLKAPARIRAVSSQFDIAPSLLAWLSHSYGLRTPPQAAWLGKGLDMFDAYRNLRDIPVKPVKGEAPGMLSGDWYLLRGQLYRVSSQLAAEAASDAEAQARLQAKLAAFDAANQQMVASGRLLPPEAVDQLVAWDAEKRNAVPAAATEASAAVNLQVRDVQLEKSHVNATFTNAGGRSSKPFVALLVVTDAAGRELAEAGSTPLQLAAGESRALRLSLPAHIAGKDNYLSVVPADPASGKHMGEGVFHLPLESR
ncbi:LTA synthase family protein [Comamonas guangdongensis]|uniref:LTA synthase family protein n=1 Tax=Comamonas guangdongensis TaxID=510515 RepID=A0ABV3ZYU2_9BURK